MLSPASMAVMGRLPPVVSATLQNPTTAVATQLSTPSVTVTAPLGVPPPGALTVTVNVTNTASPGIDGSGLSAVIAIAVLALFTVCPTPADVDAAKFALPLNEAVTLLAPAVVETSEQDVDGSVVEQLLVPSLTVTVPDGVPAPGAVTATVKFTAYAWPTTDAVAKAAALVIVVVVAAGSTVCGVPADVLVP